MNRKVVNRMRSRKKPKFERVFERAVLNAYRVLFEQASGMIDCVRLPGSSRFLDRASRRMLRTANTISKMLDQTPKTYTRLNQAGKREWVG